MSVIVYKCTVCNRLIDLIERLDGLERISRCVITNDCRGTLYKVDRKQDFVVGRATSDVAGVTNYIQRRVLYNHIQVIAKDTWLVIHNLGVNPSVQVVIDRDQEVDGQIVTTQVEVEPEEITIIDGNTLTIRFARAESGLAQCISRSAAPDVVPTSVVSEPTHVQLSNDSILTIGTREAAFSGSPAIMLKIYYLANQELTEESLLTATYDFYAALSPANSTSPWNDAEHVFVNGQKYTVRSIDIGDPVNTLGVPNGVTVAFEPSIADDLIVLLANEPYGNVDKVRNKIFRPSWNEGPTKRLESFVFGNGEFSATTDVIENVFPPVHIID